MATLWLCSAKGSPIQFTTNGFDGALVKLAVWKSAGKQAILMVPELEIDPCPLPGTGLPLFRGAVRTLGVHNNRIPTNIQTVSLRISRLTPVDVVGMSGAS